MDPKRKLAELIESTQRFLQETAPKPPPVEVDPDDWRSDFIVGVADGEIFGVADDELLADLLRVNAGSMAVPQVAPCHVGTDDQVRPALSLAPRPFSQLARRHYRLFGGICAGYNAFLVGKPYYHAHRRRPARRSARHGILCSLRSERGLLAQLARRVVTKLPPMLYGAARVA